MMKKYSKLFAILLSALLVMGIIFPLVMAESELYEGQKELFVKNVTTPPVQDGILNGHKIDGVTVDEYGSNGPTFCVTPDDMRAVDPEGNPLDIELPSYIYLYMAKDADALYLGMEIQEDAHVGDKYEFTTFLGFGDKTDADTMNSGITTTFKMDNGNSPNFDPGTWMDTRVTALSAQKVEADGTVTDTTANRKFNNPVEYVLPAWGSETTSGSLPVTFFEAELDFEDAMLGSGLAADADLPDYGYFAFELGVFNGTEKIGKIVFNNDMTGKDGAPDGEIKTVPHLLNLKTEFNATTANNANLSALSVEGGTLSPAFDANTTEYTVKLPYGTSSANVTATAAASETRVTVEGADNLDGIGFGGNETITVTLVAQNGFIKTYTLNVAWTYDSTDFYVDATNGNDSTGTGEENAPFATIEKALQAVAAREWEINEMATIHINGTFTATATDGILFGAKTVFTKGNTKLPITIKGDSKTVDVIKLPSGNAACANDYIFQTLSLPAVGAKTVNLYAGSGNIEFNNIAFGTISEKAPRIFGDTFTAKVFEGWTATQIAKVKSQNERGNIATSVAFGEGISFASGYYPGAAVGDTGGWDNASVTTVTPPDTEPTVINNGASIYHLSASAVTAPNEVALIRLVMNAGHGWLYTSDGASGKATFKSDVSLEMYGGAMDLKGSAMLRASQNTSTFEKDVSVTMEGGSTEWLQVGYSNPTIKGDATLNIGGNAAVTNTAAGGATGAQGRIVTNIYGNPVIAAVHGVFSNLVVTTDKVENYISGGTITNYFGFNNKAGSVANEVYNEISGGTITNYYGASGAATSTVDKLHNKISGTATITNFYCGYAAASKLTTVINEISGGHVSCFYGGYKQNIKSISSTVSGGSITNFYGHFKADAESVTNNVSGTASITNYYGIYDLTTNADDVNVSLGNNYGVVKNNISGGNFGTYIGVFMLSECKSAENEITGGTFEYFYGSSSCNIDTMTNNIKGGTFTNFFGSNKDTLTTLNNNVSGGKFIGTKSVDTSGNESGLGVLNGSYKSTITTQNNTFTGGSLGGVGGENQSTVTNMNNTFDGATAGRVFGTYQGTATNVHNVILSGTFTQGFDGCYRSTTDSVWTEVKDGEFQKTFYPVWARYATVDTVKTDIYGGTFKGTIHGGYGGAFGSITTNISGGKFSDSSIYLGGGSTTWPSAVLGNVTNNISGGDFSGSVAVYGGGMCGLVKGDIINNITGGTFKVFYGGNYRCYTNSTTSKLVAGTEFKGMSVLGKVINTFGAENAESGPTFNSYVMGGDLGNSEAVIDYCEIENTIHAGTFKSNFYGGTDTAKASPASIKNTVNGGTFTGKFWAGGNDGACTGNIENTVSGGTFNGYFFGGARKANVGGDIINNIKGGTWNSYFFGGSDQNTNDATAANGENGPVTYTIGGSIKNTITGGTFETAASGAGFGTITGNVENTIKGNPKIEFGYYGVQATLMDTVVKGNVLNLITKDENGVAPTFPKKNMAIDYVFDNAEHTYVYTTDGSNIGFAATGASGTVYTDSTKSTKVSGGDPTFTTVEGYVETIVEAGTFNGHYYAGGGLDITGKNEDGYGVINIVRGDPVFNYVWAGGCISSTKEAAYKTYNEINGGTYNDIFSSLNRTAASGSYINDCEVVTVIKGGVFNDRVQFAAPWSDSHSNQHQRTAPYSLTIEGGTFNEDVYGLYYDAETKESGTQVALVGGYLKEGGDISININGGTFAKNIYATGTPYNVGKYADNAFATINIEPTKGDVTILGTVESRFDNEIVNLKGGEYKLILGADASIEATSATGDVKIAQESAWKKQTYVTMPEGNDAVVTVSGPHCFDKIGTSVVAVKGGVQLAGATMILTDRVAVRALFDKVSVDSIDDFTFSFTMGEETLASGNKESLESYNDAYYCIVLAKIGANDFTSTVNFAGSDLVWENEFSVKSLAELAEKAWADNEVDVQLAKAMRDFATIVADPDATLTHNLTPDMSLVEGFEAKGTIDETTVFQVSGKGLVMGNAVGIRIYGTAGSDVTSGYFTIKVNGNDVTDKAVIGAGENNAYTIDLYVDAKSMSTALKIEIIEKETGKVCLELTDRVDAIAASYPTTHEKYKLVQQLLVYIQAAVAYANA